MTSIKYRDKKLGRYRRGVIPLGTKGKYPSWSPNKKKKKKKAKYKIISKYEGLCAICSGKYAIGMEVMYDPKKQSGMKVAHIDCYENQLRKKEKE